MKKYLSIILVLGFCFLYQSCQDDDITELNCSTPSYITISDYLTSPSRVEVSWNLAPNAEGYLLEHYVDDVLFEEFTTDDLFQLVPLDLEDDSDHKFNVYAACCGDYIQALSAYVNVPTEVNSDCPPPSNITVASIENGFITFTWDNNPAVTSYTVTDYSPSVPTVDTVTSNTITLPLDPANGNNSDFGFVSNCPEGSSIEIIQCVAWQIDIDDALECERTFYCHLASSASMVNVEDDRFSGSPQDIWHRYCPSQGRFPCVKE